MSDEMKKGADEGNPNKAPNASNTPPPPGWTVRPAQPYYMPPPPHPGAPPPPYPPYFYPPPFPSQSQAYGIPPAPIRPPANLPPQTTGPLPPWLQKDFRPIAPVKVNPVMRPPVAPKEPIKISLNDYSKTKAKTEFIKAEAAAPAKSSSGGGDQWPPELKAYIERCFARCSTNAERDLMEKLLKTKVQDALLKNALHSINWNVEPELRLNSMAPAAKKKPTVVKGNFTVVSAASAKQAKPAITSYSEDTSKKNERAKRFTFDASPPKHPKFQVALTPSPSADVIDWDEYTIVGTSTQLEKPYLRLTSAPDPSTVRPLPVLKKVLEFLKLRWLKGRDYAYICDQFKSLRQDLTVQRIKNDFTVEVYETHARFALEKLDMGEYNQCQTQLKLLYEAGLTGHESEFIAYRILYLLGTKNRSELNSLMSELSPEQHSIPEIRHALEVRSAVALNNYHSLFKLYRTVPNIGCYLMDCFLNRERLNALRIICRAYRPSFNVSVLANILAFNSTESCLEFLRESQAVLIGNDEQIDTKASLSSTINISNMFIHSFDC